MIALPDSGPQDYETLTRWVMERLPTENYVIVAESFSGAIAARISVESCPYLKGIVFVASFLSSPSRLAIRVAQLLPLQRLAQLPGAAILHRLICLGRSADRKTVQRFCRVVGSVPPQTLQARLESMARLEYSGFTARCPATYIRATGDRLVSAGKILEFSAAYPRLELKMINGPHFLIQTCAKEVAIAIREIVSELHSSNIVQ